MEIDLKLIGIIEFYKCITLTILHKRGQGATHSLRVSSEKFRPIGSEIQSCQDSSHNHLQSVALGTASQQRPLTILISFCPKSFTLNRKEEIPTIT
jgi:hypothetical protein